MTEREKLPFLEFSRFAGLNTKTSPDIVPFEQLIVANNCDLFISYGAITKPNGMSRVLTSILNESGSPAQISWVGFYKAADLDGQILRHTLIAGGSNVFRVNGTSLTQLTGLSTNPITTSRTANLIHHHKKFDDFLLIQNQNPDLIGQGDDPIKYDGTDIQRWGIVAPGFTETVREAFSSASSFAVTNGTVTDDTTTTQDGASVNLTKTNTVTSSVFMQKTITAFDATASGEDRVFVWVFIPRGQFSNLATSGRALSIYMGSDADLTTNFQRHDFEIGSLFEGWNLLRMITDPAPATPAATNGGLGTVTGTPVLTALQTFRFEVITDALATLVSGVRWDRLFTTDEGRLTSADGAAGSNQLTKGVYSWKTTFVSKYGFESNAGPQSADLSITTTGNQADLTAIPTSSDPQVTARKIYRTVADGAIWLFLTRIEDNVTTTFTDTTQDTSLGETSPPESGSVNLDNSTPPKAGIVKVWKRTVFLAGDPSNPETVFFSEDDQPESFPTLNTVTLDDKITCMYETLSGLVIETETGKWQVIGDNPDFKFDKVIDGIGCVGRRAGGEARLAGFSSDRDGMYLYDLNDPIKISEVIRDQWDSINRTNIELMHITHAKSLNGMFIFAADSDAKFTNIFVYQYLQDVNSRADLINGWWWKLVLPDSTQTTNGNVLNILDAEEIEDTDGDFKLYGGGDDGMLYHLFDPSTKNNIDAAGVSIPVTTTFHTKYVRAGDIVQKPQTQTHMEGSSGRIDPIYIEVRRSGTGATCWEVTIDTADGSATDPTPRDNAVVVVNFGSNESLKRVPIISSLTPAEFVRLKVTNSQPNVNDSIQAVRLYYKLRPGQYQV